MVPPPPHRLEPATVIPPSIDDPLALEVAAIRELPLKSAVPIQRLSAAAFAERTRASPADPSTVATYVAFGFMRHDPHARVAVLGHASYLGLFDFATHELLLRDDLEGAAQGVLVHEIAHALQDQSFGMASAAEDDRALAVKSLYEGDATLVRELYAAKQNEQSPADRVAQAILIVRTTPRQQLAAGLGVPSAAMKEPRWDEMLSTYVDGMVFVGTLHQRGGFDLVDQAYARLPESTEQILHPDKYLQAEHPIEVAAPEPLNGKLKIAEGTLGELRIRLLLGRCSKTAVVDGWGWGGDRFLVAEGPGRELTLRWNTEWDTEGDAKRFETGLTHASSQCWPSARGDGFWIGSNTTVRRDGKRVTFTRGS